MRHGSYRNIRQPLAVIKGKIMAVLAGPPSSPPLYTYNGIDWLTGTIDATMSGNVMTGAYGNGVYVMLVSSTSTTAASVMTSTNGINWTARTKSFAYPIGAANVSQRFIYSPTFSCFLGVSGTQGNALQRSNDGVTWTAVNSPSPGVNISSLMDTGSSVVLSSFNSDGTNKIDRTTNLTSWTAVTQPSGNYVQHFTRTLSGGTIGFAQNNVTRSTNGGSSWAAVSATTPYAGNGTSIRSAVHSNGRVVALNTGATNSKYSTDNGSNWTVVSGTLPPLSNTSRLIVTYDDKFIYFPNTTTATTYGYSTDGINWQTLPLPHSWAIASGGLIAGPA